MEQGRAADNSIDYPAEQRHAFECGVLLCYCRIVFFPSSFRQLVPDYRAHCGVPLWSKTVCQTVFLQFFQRFGRIWRATPS